MSGERRRTRWADVALAFALWLLLAPMDGAGAQAIADQLAACKDEGSGTQLRIDACTQVIGQAKDNDDIRTEALLQRGVLYEAAGDKDAAIGDYTEAIKLDPSDPDVFNNRGQAYDSKGEPDLAIADYSQSIRLSRDNPRAFFNRGLAYANKAEYQRAITDFDQAIKLDPRDAEAYVSRGAVQEELGNEDAARADYRKALEIVPDHDDAKEALARLGN